jgi:hypothetical protein
MSEHTWEGDDRRRAPSPDDLRAHFDARFDALEKLIKSGFPDGDPAAHRLVHEGYIRDANASHELRQAVVKQVLTGTVWATLALVGGVLWAWLKSEVKK